MACIRHPAITITFTNGTDLWECAFDEFTAEPRQFVDSVDLTFSVSGAAIQQGNSRINRRTWAIAAFTDKKTGYDLEELFRNWDLARASGQAAVIGVTDQTRVPDPANPITASAVFTAPPTFEPRPGAIQLVSFGLTEV